MSGPFVVVTLGTSYMHQEDVLVRIIAALERLEARVLVLTATGSTDERSTRGLTFGSSSVGPTPPCSDTPRSW